MKSITLSCCLFILTAIGFSQQITGNWEGALSVQDNVIPVVFHIGQDSSGHFTARFDSPKQNAFDLPCNEVSISGDSLFIKMKILNGSFRGLLNKRGDNINGIFFQGAAVPLALHKTSEKPSPPAVNQRPQTPHPPYPYKSEEVDYYNADRSIHFGATFTAPLPDSTVNYFRRPVYPAVLLITGSGPQDRDETIFNHKSFAVLADYLTRHGIAVLRVDDRGVGKSSGRFSAATTADFADDAIASLLYLRSRPEVDTNAIGLLGHSEGGIIAPMVASRRPDIKFIILLAGPAITITDLMEQQSNDVLLSQGLPKEQAAQYRPLYKKLVTAILQEKDSSQLFAKARLVFDEWKKNIADSVVINTTGVSDEISLKRFLNAFIHQLRTPGQPWFAYFLQINPADYLGKLKCPVLALNGEKDIQVAAGPNLAAIQQFIKASGNPLSMTYEVPGCNHLFQHCKKCTVAEYGELTETIAPEVLAMVGNWINKVVNK